MQLSFFGTEEPKLDSVTITDANLSSCQGGPPASWSTIPGKLPWRAGVKSLSAFFLYLKRHSLLNGDPLSGLVWRGGPESPVRSLWDAWKKRDSQNWIEKWFGLYRLRYHEVVCVQRCAGLSSNDDIYSASIGEEKSGQPFFSAEDILIYWDRGQGEGREQVTSPDTIGALADTIITQETRWRMPAKVADAPHPELPAGPGGVAPQRFIPETEQGKSKISVRFDLEFASFDKRELDRRLAGIKEILEAEAKGQLGPDAEIGGDSTWLPAGVSARCSA
jgi:hypothetical protein